MGLSCISVALPGTEIPSGLGLPAPCRKGGGALTRTKPSPYLPPTPQILSN